MKPRGGPPLWLMNSRGGPPILRGGPPLGTISMDQTVLQKRFSHNVLIAVAEILRKKEGRKREKIVKQKLLQLFFS